jgi:hypothetical protein
VLVASVGVVTYLLLFGELFVRVAEPQSLMPRYVTGTAWGVRGNIPGARYRHRTPEVDVEYRINAQGMRADRVYSMEKHAGACRIGLFGDSYFVGYELDLRDSIAEKLERGLGRAGYQVEVLNFAVSGFGTAEMLMTYRGYAKQFGLDVVLFQFQETDFDDNVRSGLYRLVGGELVKKRSTYMPAVGLQDFLMKVPLYTFVADNSHLYNLARQRVTLAAKRALADIRREEASDVAKVDSGPEARPQLNYAGRLTGALLVNAMTEVSRDNSAFYVVDIPAAIDSITFRSRLSGIPETDLKALRVISPLGLFTAKASAADRLYFRQGARHLTPRGARLLSEVIMASLQADSHIRSCGTAR